MIINYLPIILLLFDHYCSFSSSVNPRREKEEEEQQQQVSYNRKKSLFRKCVDSFLKAKSKCKSMGDSIGPQYVRVSAAALCVGKLLKCFYDEIRICPI